MPDHSVVHRYARCESYPEWGVGTVAGIYFTGRRRRDAAVGARAVQPRRADGAGGKHEVRRLLKARPGEERVERFLVAAQRAMAEGEYELAAQRLIYARDAEPQNVAVLRLMTLAFWNAGNLEAAARAVREWARADGRPPRRAPLRRAHLRGHRRDRPRRGGGRAGGQARADGHGRVGAAGAAAAAAAGPRGRRSKRSSAPGRLARRAS